MMKRAVLACAAAILLLSSGCAPDPYQTTVRKVTPGSETTSAITPIERGKLRREALEAVRQGVDAWLADDLEAMKRYFSDEQVAYYQRLREESERVGRFRIRKHRDVKMDVVEMSEDGTEVSVTYAFVNDSYWADRSGRVLEKPTHKQSQIQIGAKKIDGRWLIVRMIGVPDTIR